MNFDDYVEMFLYFNTILPPAAVRLNRVTILGLTPSPGCRAVQSHGFVSIIATRYNRAVNDNYNGMPEAAQAKAMTRAAIDGNLTELNLGGIRQTASELALHSLAQGFKPNDDYEKMLFYYHPDHLGSSSYITNLDGEVMQHIEYVPFGEVFIEERNNTWNTPYLFNAKKLDEETGLYYYGARYYEPRLSLWMSVDPISNFDPRNRENYFDGEHNDGVYNYRNLNPYIYCYQSPISLVDPNGKQAVPGAILGAFTEYLSKVGEKMIFGKMSFSEAKGNLTWKDALDIGVAGAIGAVSGTAKFAKFVASPIGKKIMKVVTEIGFSSLEAGLKSIYGEEFSLEAVLVEVGMGDLLGHFLPKKIFKEAANKSRHDLNRAKELMGRKSATPKVTRKQAVKLKNEQKNMRINESLEAVSDGTRQTISKTAGSRTQRATQKSN